ncbi:MAG: DUF503 domain-containing protein [Anaerolineales bacterium]|nr:DUF503 domain-containing protein [Anaerolineales bacterium]
MSVGLLTLHVLLPGCLSLKEKRSRLKPLLARLHREFNASVAEMDHMDRWGEAVLGCAVLGNENNHVMRSLQTITRWVEHNWPDITVIADEVEIR